MADLYTSLTRIKMAMNGGALPPMTPLTEQAMEIIDPAFTIGMGALMEDAERGLRCPIKGCGEWVHNLSMHHRRVHRSLGSVSIIRSALSIDPKAPLMSRTARERYVVAGRHGAAHRHDTRTKETYAKMVATARANRAQRKATVPTIGERNTRDMCEAQLRHKFADFRSRYGRSPSENEYSSLFGDSPKGWENTIYCLIRKIYGSFENAASQLDIQTLPISVVFTLEQILENLRAWYEENGELPSRDEANARNRYPLIPKARPIMRSLKCDSWDSAMRQVASMLHIYGGRYGLSERKRA